jgi:hypothetical protein
VAEERPLPRNQPLSRDHSWIPDATVATLRDVIARYLDGDRSVADEVEQLSASLASAARAKDFTPERMLIALRSLWRDFSFTQHDRLQLVALYDRIVKRTIDKYYED